MTPRIFFPLSGLSFVARYFVALCSNTLNKLKFSHVLLTFQAIARYCRDLQTKSNMFCIIRAPSQTQFQRIVIHLARNADKGGGVLMSIILPNLNHSFISPVPVPVPDPDFRIFFTPDGWRDQHFVYNSKVNTKVQQYDIKMFCFFFFTLFLERCMSWKRGFISDSCN